MASLGSDKKGIKSSGSTLGIPGMGGTSGETPVNPIYPETELYYEKVLQQGADPDLEMFDKVNTFFGNLIESGIWDDLAFFFPRVTWGGNLGAAQIDAVTAEVSPYNESDTSAVAGDVYGVTGGGGFAWQLLEYEDISPSSAFTNSETNFSVCLYLEEIVGTGAPPPFPLIDSSVNDTLNLTLSYLIFSNINFRQNAIAGGATENGTLPVFIQATRPNSTQIRVYVDGSPSNLTSTSNTILSTQPFQEFNISQATKHGMFIGLRSGAEAENLRTYCEAFLTSIGER